MPSWEKERKVKAGVEGAAPAPSPAGAGRTSAPSAGMSRDLFLFLVVGVIAGGCTASL